MPAHVKHSLSMLTAAVLFGAPALAEAATAQTDPPPTTPAQEAPPPTTTAAPETTPDPSVPPAAEPEPEPEPPVIEQAEKPVEIEEPAEAAPAEEEETKWYDNFEVGAFVDAYAGMNFAFPRPEYGTNIGRAFDSANGFSFAWAGLNVAYTGKKAGATLDLRFGPATNAGWQDPRIPGIQHIKQAYVTWTPIEKLSFDLGRFDTIYGAEVAESWKNHTYTRGFLYNLAQPFWHTGLRIRGTVNDYLSINGLIVDGWGRVWDNNRGKGFGAQLGITPSDTTFLALGYLASPEHDELQQATDPVTGEPAVDEDGEPVMEAVDGVNRDFRHLIDLVFTVNLEKFSFAFNADYIFDDGPTANSQWYGFMASARVNPIEKFAFALRAELMGDPDGWLLGTEDTIFGSGTATLEFMPSEVISMRLEHRSDIASNEIFVNKNGNGSQYQGTLTLGVAVHSF